MMIRNSNCRSFLKKIGAAGATSIFLQAPELFAEQRSLATTSGRRSFELGGRPPRHSR
jgi:hypothetical protein